MITSIPVGSWWWENKRQAAEGEATERCARLALTVQRVLVDLGLSDADVRALVTIRLPSARKPLFSRDRIRISTSFETAESHLIRVLQEGMLDSGRDMESAMLTVALSCPGKWLEGGTELRAERIFSVLAHASSGSAEDVTLQTYSDAWLTRNLRGHMQTEIHAQNAPRLTAALQEISRLTGDEPDPGDPTWYATPTVTGFEDLPDDDPELLDTWNIFEIPYRLKNLHSQLPNDANLYEPSTTREIRYVLVVKGKEILGYLWYCDADNAAGYEPRSAAGDEAFEAGVEWLAHLSAAKDRGLTPSQAVMSLAAAVAGSTGTRIMPDSDRTAASLDELQDASGRQ